MTLGLKMASQGGFTGQERQILGLLRDIGGENEPQLITFHVPE